MNKVFFAIAIYLFNLTVISCEINKPLINKNKNSPEQEFIIKLREYFRSTDDIDRGDFINIIKKIIPNISLNSYCKKNRMTALYLACFYGDFELVKLFIDHKDNVNQCAKVLALEDGKYIIKQRSPLGIALENGFENIAKLLHIAGARPINTNQEEVMMYNEMLNPSSQK